MQRIALGVKISLAMGLLACSSASTPAAPGGGDNVIPPIGNEGDGGSGGSGLGGVGGDGAGGVGGAVSEGACDNPADEAALAAVRTPNTNARGISATCAVASCSDELGQGEAAFLECITTRCLNTNLPSVSPECRTCYAELGWCAQLLCNTFCANTPCTDSCLNCSEGSTYQACLAALDRCAGRPSRDCE